MEQIIEEPRDADWRRIAEQIVHGEKVLAAGGQRPKMEGALEDLDILQFGLDRGFAGPNDTYDLQSLGLIFGRVIARQMPEFHWVMVEDDYGRDPALRFRDTSLLLFPLTMILKRVEQGERIEMSAFFSGLQKNIAQIRQQMETE